MRFTTRNGAADLANKKAFSLGSDDWTIEAWVKPTGSSPLFYAEFVPGDPGLDPQSIHFSIIGTPLRLLCQLFDAKLLVPDNSVLGERPIVIDAWQHVACVRRGPDLIAFVSGQDTGTGRVRDGLKFGTWSGGRIGSVPGSRPSVDTLVGPIRMSRGARYTAAFEPQARWAIDEDTLLQYLVRRRNTGFNDRWDSQSIWDESAVVVDGGLLANDAVVRGGMVPEDEDTPCSVGE